MSLYSLPSYITFSSIEGERLDGHSNFVGRNARRDLKTRKSDTKRSLHSEARARRSTVDLFQDSWECLPHQICSNGDPLYSEHSNHEIHELVGKFHFKSFHDVDIVGREAQEFYFGMILGRDVGAPSARMPCPDDPCDSSQTT